MRVFRPGTRRWWLLAITVVVVAVHAWLTWSVADLMDDLRPNDRSAIQRMEATYVSELKLTAPPVAAPAPAKVLAPHQPEPAVKRPPKAAAPKASEPEPPPEPEPAPSPQAASEPEPAASTLAVADASSAPASAASEAASAPASGPPFVWPLATRVSYKVTGYFRGDIHGKARVEWVRRDSDYQVHVETSLGLIGSLNMISAGIITPDGLAPNRFEQVNRLLIKTSPPRTVVFEDDQVVLDSGERLSRTPGMQDGASQFIQLSYQFTMKPELLSPGKTIYMDLALLKRVERIAYDVVAKQVLHTPLGDVPTFHVKPRKMSAEGGVLPVEIWFAPGLQYLPVRVLVRVDDKTYMDWQMDRAPEQTPLDPETARPPLSDR
jgi:hypothetical protein